MKIDPKNTAHRAFMMAAVLVTLTCGQAWAKDTLSASVSNATGSPVQVNNGQPSGTIQLFYTVNANQFPLGPFATFDVNWLVTAGSPATTYGTGVTFSLVQDQNGGNVALSPSPDSFLLTSAGQQGVSTVTVSITNDKDGNPPSSADGTELVGNLKLVAGNKVNTVTNVQVHILLVHPSACLKAYTFVTDADLTQILATTNLNVPAHGPNAGTINASQPGQFSVNALIANVCATSESFDVRVNLDPLFNTNPSTAPANAVFVYTASGEFDTSNFGTLTEGTGTGYQQNVCLQNVTVPGNSSLLVSVHSEVTKYTPVSALPADGTFDFSSALTAPVNNNCTSPLVPSTLATPNPATFALPFTY
jgi:hypothetical protein